MVYMMIQHKVADFTRWKAVFDSRASQRRSGGELSAEVFRDVDNANQLTLLLGWDSVTRARAYAAHPAFKAALEAAGVTDAPSFTFFTTR